MITHNYQSPLTSPNLNPNFKLINNFYRLCQVISTILEQRLLVIQVLGALTMLSQLYHHSLKVVNKLHHPIKLYRFESLWEINE